MHPQRLLHLVAHGGNTAEYPENTLPALRSAIDLGTRFIVLDVQLAADGIPMVIRDHDLLPAAGMATSIFELRAAELAHVEVGERRRFGERFRGTCIPRLSDMLRVLAQHPEVTAFVSVGRASLVRFGRDPAVAQVLQTMRPYRSRCVFVSADLPAAFRAREMGEWQIGWTLPAYDNHTRLKYEALHPEFLLCDRSFLPQSGALWRGPWRWVVQDVSSIELALNVAGRGADFIATTQVRFMSEAMHAHSAAALTRARAAV